MIIRYLDPRRAQQIMREMDKTGVKSRRPESATITDLLPDSDLALYASPGYGECCQSDKELT
jgi:hypothetical protein